MFLPQKSAKLKSKFIFLKSRIFYINIQHRFLILNCTKRIYNKPLSYPYSTFFNLLTLFFFWSWLYVRGWGHFLFGSISPNFFAKQKVAAAHCFAKNLQFNFSNKVVRLKLGQNCQNMYPIRQRPFGIKGVESCARKKITRKSWWNWAFEDAVAGGAATTPSSQESGGGPHNYINKFFW